ncbi:MAG TPA: translocation/assembly module TamB domain-containing protein [Brumimicrobium sp.]|nr:translocation/assembly module TamB domain-containing protein [Brumimicrobium sp.]
MTEKTEEKNKKKSVGKRPWWKRTFRILGWIALVLLILLFSLLLFIRSPWGQNIIVDKATHYLSEKTKTEVSIKKLFITFTGKLNLQGLYLEDLNGDTLLYSEELKANIPLFPIIMGNPISINGVKWKGLRANVVRKDTITGFNFQFLIDAFASDDKPEKVDTTGSEPPKISVGTIRFTDFKVNFDDAVNGMKANLDLGKFYLKGKNIDLKNMDYEVAKISIENTKASYIQSKLSAPSDSSESGELPYLSLKKLKLKNVTLHYASVPDSMVADMHVGDLALTVPKVDLRKQDIQVGKLKLHNSNVQFISTPQRKIEADTFERTTPAEIQAFVWPDWNIDVASIDFESNYFHYQNGERSQEINGFDPNYIVVDDFIFKAKNIALNKDESANLQINDLSFSESSGFKLNQLALLVALNSKELTVDNLKLKTANSSIDTDLKAEFASLQAFIEKPEESRFSLDLKSFIVDVKDAFAFQPTLKENEYMAKLAKHKFSGNIKANGKLSQVNLSEFLVNWGENTSITTNGQFMNLIDFDNFETNIDNLTINSNRSDIAQFVSEKELGITLPKTVVLKTQFKGKLDDLKANVFLTIPEGKVNIDGTFKKSNKIAFDANIAVIDLQLGNILNNPTIGMIAFEMKASGSGNNINDLNAELASTFSKMEFNNYDFSALQLDGELNDGKGDVTLTYKDKNLDLNIDSKIQLYSVSPKIFVDIQMEGADLYALGLTEKEIRTKLMMNASFKGNSDLFEVETHVTEGVAIYKDDTYYLGPFDLTARAAKDSTSMDISSNFLNGKLRVNASIDSTIHAIQHHLEGYFSDYEEHIDSITKPIMLEFNMKLSNTKLITGFLVPEIRTMDTLNLDVNFNQEEKTLAVNMSLLYIDYAEKTIDSLLVNLSATEDMAKFLIGFNELDASPFLMHRTYFDGDLKDGLLKLNFNALHNEKELYVVQTEISGKVSDLMVHFNPEKLILNQEEWSIPEDNKINYSDKKITAENVVFSNKQERITVANDLMGASKNNIGIGFENFNLSHLLALFNKDDLLASGEFQGNIVAIDPFENFGLNADFSIENLTALKASLGKLTLKAKTQEVGNYNLDLGIKGSDVDLTVKGDFSPNNKGSELDFNLDLNRIGMETIALLSDNNLKDASGYISGKVALKGDVRSPEYKGKLLFKDAAFNVTELNSKFQLPNSKIEIDNSLITLNQFTIKDEQGNTFILDGSITTENFSDPAFDMRFKGKNFQALNSTEKDNDLYYGKLNFDMDGTITGNLSFPLVNTNLGINENTNFTYVIPESQAKLEKHDGIVEFVNKENPDDILTRSNDSIVAKLSGIELHAKLRIDKGAAFNVIIDPSTGDNLNVSGVADLDFNIEQNGGMSLTGRFDILDGHYELSLYNLVKRKFELENGSSIVWRGDPLDAELNVTAKYEVETSASGLMASQTAGASDEVLNKYRQQLPFFVYMHIKGELEEPKLEFGLDMPEDSRGAIDGTVYSRIKQLSGEEDELNKQVFSLLVLKKFYPNGGSDGSEGGAEQLVRKRVNEALSDQLNAFSDKLLGNTGIELDFGLNSYTDYQGESAQQRTDLNISAQKKLFDDRLIIQVGTNVNVQGDKNPGEENAVIGNANIQYLLTKDGRWRLKGFRNNEFENVIDGQVYVNGISIIFQRQFNTWKELWAPSPKLGESDGESKEKSQKKSAKKEKAKKEEDITSKKEKD